MSQAELYKIKQEVKERALAKMRYGWFCEHRKTGNAKAVCRKYGISRSRFYYWKKRVDLQSGSGKRLTTKADRLIAYSRKPKTNPREYPEETIRLIKRIRKRTNRGAEYIWFQLRDRYTVYVSVTGIYKVLKREGREKAARNRLDITMRQRTCRAKKCR